RLPHALRRPRRPPHDGEGDDGGARAPVQPRRRVGEGAGRGAPCPRFRLQALPSEPMEPLNAARTARVMGERFGLAPGARVVVGASGGLDSTVLLRLLHAAGFAVAAAHVNYGLRGEASDADEAFVRALAAELGVPCHVRRVALPEGENRQDAARRARYAFFEEVAEGEGVVAVAHHRDDQAETVL